MDRFPLVRHILNLNRLGRLDSLEADSVAEVVAVEEATLTFATAADVGHLMIGLHSGLEIDRPQ